METDETTSLERKKLTLEIADLERPWWKRPAYVLAALPTVLAVVALSVGFINGFFSAQMTNLQIQTTKLEIQRHDLEAQVKDFEGKRDDIVKKYEEAKTKLEKVNSMSSFEAYQANKCEDELQKLKASRK